MRVLCQSQLRFVTPLHLASSTLEIRAHFTFYMLVLAELLVAAGMCAAWYFLTAPISLRFLLWIALALVILVVGSVIWARRTTPRWLAFLPVVWEARACACPWCRTRVDSAPCEEHGSPGCGGGSTRRAAGTLAPQHSG